MQRLKGSYTATKPWVEVCSLSVAHRAFEVCYFLSALRCGRSVLCHVAKVGLFSKGVLAQHQMTLVLLLPSCLAILQCRVQYQPALESICYLRCSPAAVTDLHRPLLTDDRDGSGLDDVQHSDQFRGGDLRHASAAEADAGAKRGSRSASLRGPSSPDMTVQVGGYLFCAEAALFAGFIHPSNFQHSVFADRANSCLLEHSLLGLCNRLQLLPLQRRITSYGPGCSAL